MRPGRWLLGGYLLLVVASNGVRWARSDQIPRIPADAAGIHLSIGHQPPIRIAYRTWQSADPVDAPTVLLLHGSPGDGRVFSGLASRLEPGFRVLAPDYPGFGHSQEPAGDYSIATDAAYMLALLDELKVDQAHAVGFSLGGGVALEMARLQPDRLRSITLLSALGVQEHELLGEYHLNHALHGLQLIGLRAALAGLPHFGRWDGAFFGLAYARSFYDTDQRPLREILTGLEVPTLILHGTYDKLVPVAAAREHHRLVPQSRLVEVDGGHFLLFQEPEGMAAPLLAFLDEVEAGAATTRSQATAARRAEAGRPIDSGALGATQGFALVLIWLLLAAATLVSEDLTCIAAGLLVAQGRLGLLSATTACGAGIFLGDLALYGAGRFLGRRGLGRRPWRWFLTPSSVEASRRWFEVRGPAVILTSRFLPGARLPTYFAAGLLRAGFWRFALWFALAVTLWTPILVGLAAFLGTRMFGYFEAFSRYALPAFLAVVGLLWLLTRTLPLLVHHRGRRRLLGRWKRLRHWEFWPPWVVYPPVVLWVLALAVRHRGLAVFAAANPAIPHGGFIGESKADILARLNPATVAPYRLLPAGLSPEERRQQIDDFIADSAGGLPVVLKPDAGQRGTGVLIARRRAQIDDYLVGCGQDLIVQCYVPGVELGVFWLRLPGEARGSIFSVTEKQLPAVRGDGRRSLEELVLDDPRAVALADLYLERLGAERHEVPPAAEAIPLADLGTHCRGAIFLDGASRATAQLTARVESIARSFDGFYFGRFDLRAPTFEAFERGEQIQVIELNGVTSEATHIYDPRYSVFDAYRVLFRQWRLAFEIGAENLRRGRAQPCSTLALLGDLVTYRSAGRG